MADSKPIVAALVAQMPDTDQQKLNPKDPNAVNSASKFTGPEPVDAEKVWAAIMAGGRESVLELLASLRDPADADFNDYKAGYVLHSLCLFAGQPGKEDQRRMLAETMASQLKSQASPATKRILIRQLQVAGGKESIAALGECLADNELCDSAVQALLAIPDGAAEPLRKALGSAGGRNLVAITQALGVLGDRESLAALRKLLTHEDPDARRSAAHALANLGDVESTGTILQFTDAAAPGWERTHATGVCHLLAEKLAAAGTKETAVRIYTHLRDTRKEERHVSESAVRALHALK